MRGKFFNRFVAMIAIVATFWGSSDCMTVLAAGTNNNGMAILAEDVDLPDNFDDSKEYFEFNETNQRMDSNGNFTFSFSNAMSSDYFTPTSTSIKVTAKATSSSATDTTYNILLYKLGSSSNLGNVKYIADGNSYEYTFKNLDTSETYCLYFSKPFGSNGKFTGSGNVSPIKK